jgi:hypothetical protein
LVIASLALISVAAAVVVARDRLPLNIPGLGDWQAGDTPLTITSPPPADLLDLADAGMPADAGILEEDAGVADAGMDGGMDAGIEPSLELIVDPRVDALLSDGGILGRTPVTLPMPPGRHVLSLSNPALGIQTSRAVTVAPEGRTTVRIYLSKGFVNVRAPAGATVQVDGRNVGKAPIDELDLYEGYHRLVVVVNGARWQKSFLVEPNQRVNFSVDFESEEDE